MFPVQTSERAAAPHLRRDIGRSRAVARPGAWRAALLGGSWGRAPSPAPDPAASRRRGLPRALGVGLLRAPESCLRVLPALPGAARSVPSLGSLTSDLACWGGGPELGTRRGRTPGRTMPQGEFQVIGPWQRPLGQGWETLGRAPGPTGVPQATIMSARASGLQPALQEPWPPLALRVAWEMARARSKLPRKFKAGLLVLGPQWTPSRGQ